MRSLRSLGARGPAAALCLLFALALVAARPAAAQQVQVGVTIDKVANLHPGDYFHCFDPQVIGCGRPDFYAKITFVGQDRTVFCDRTDFIEDRDTITPGWTCKVNGVETTPVLTPPVKLILEIWDFDGGARGIDGDDPADIAPGPAKALTVDLMPDTQSLASDGDDAHVELTTTMQAVATPPAPIREVEADHLPALPGVGDVVDILARSIGVDHCSKPSDAIEIWVANSAQVASHTEPPAPALVCTGTDLCTFTPSGLTSGPGKFAYKAVTVNGTQRHETPWRVVDVTDFSRVSPLDPIVLMAGVATDPLGVVDRGKTLDIVYYAGTGFDLVTPTGRDAFNMRLSDQIKKLWGVETGCGSPTSFHEHQQSVSFWVNTLPVEVSTVPLLNECSRKLDYTLFAEANAVLHDVACRDLSVGSNFTAGAPAVGWHEIHHAAYGLADEYCCNSIYWQANPYPNLYLTKPPCDADPLSGGECTALGGFLNLWFRVDPKDDVMVFNGTEGAASRRRADWYFDQLSHHASDLSSAAAAGPRRAAATTAAGEDPNAKSLWVRFAMDGDTLTPGGAGVEYSPTRSFTGDPDLFRVQLLGFDGQVISEIATWDPRLARSYGQGFTRPDVDGGEIARMQPVADALIPVPFSPDLAAVRFTDPSGHVFGSIDVVPVVGSFCQQHPDDADCTAWQANGAASLSIQLSAAPGSVTTGSQVTFVATIANGGPAAVTAATGATAVIDLPPSVSAVSCATAAGTCNAAGNHLTVTLGSLAGGASATVQVIAQVGCGVAYGTPIQATAAVTSPLFDPDPSDDQAAVTVHAVNPPPVLVCPADLKIGNDAGLCSAVVSPGFATATDNCASPVVTGVRADGRALNASYPVGTTLLTWTATDSAGAIAACTQRVTVEDREAPVIQGAAVDKPVIWPPNHSMTSEAVSYTLISNCPGDQATAALRVTSNEPVNGTGDGNSSPDWQVIDPHHVQVRAERAGSGNGRVYTITIDARDAHGNASQQAVTVTVPKSHK
jgi:hypothetical protein